MIEKPAFSHGWSNAERDALYGWWVRVHSDDASGQDRADRAALRRCHDLTAVACTAAYGRVASMLGRLRVQAGWEPYREYQLNRLALVIGLAAHLRHEGDQRVPQAMRAGRTQDSTAAVSELRFQRLATTDSEAELFVGLRRTLPLIDGRVSFRHLCGDLLDWGDRVRRRWVYDYFDDSATQHAAAAAAAPSGDDA